MNRTIKKYIGKQITFKYQGYLFSGYFCGIGNINNKYGMVFINTKSSGINISNQCCILISPLNIKCVLYDKNILNLKKLCRKILNKNNLEYYNDNKIYHSIRKIKEIKEYLYV